MIISKPGYPPICYGYVNPVIAERLVKEFILGDNTCPEFVIAALEPNEILPSFDDFPRSQYEKKIILKNCGHIDPEDINQYINIDGYSGLAQALQLEPENVIEEISTSGLRGRGGAGFPAGRKWSLCRRQPGRTKYIICNADEGDPGAFMDRSILESDPHAVIEGLIIGGYAIGASRGYIYVRAEYPLAVKRIETALKRAKKLNFLGKNILGSDFSFNIKLFRGSGAFVCGEATAMAASIEGNAGTPRAKPPRMTESGLFGKPTIVNNVKTLALVPQIINNGIEWFRSTGTENSPGTAVFALAGKIVNTGLVEDGKERVEYPGYILFGNAAARVTYLNPHRAVISPGSNPDLSVLYNGLGGVHQNVHEYLIELVRITRDFREIFVVFFDRGFVFDLVPDDV